MNVHYSWAIDYIILESRDILFNLAKDGSGVTIENYSQVWSILNINNQVNIK